MNIFRQKAKELAQQLKEWAYKQEQEFVIKRKDKDRNMKPDEIYARAKVEVCHLLMHECSEWTEEEVVIEKRSWLLSDDASPENLRKMLEIKEADKRLYEHLLKLNMDNLQAIEKGKWPENKTLLLPHKEWESMHLSFPGQLFVEGMKIVDKDGKEVPLKAELRPEAKRFFKDLKFGRDLVPCDWAKELLAEDEAVKAEQPPAAKGRKKRKSAIRTNLKKEGST